MEYEVRRPMLCLSLLDRNGQVPERSGLNWWNASGRARNENEVYIALPSAKVDQARAVFGSAARGTTFWAHLHDGREMRMRLEGEQGTDRQTAKQISSDNSKTLLGEWMLRVILGIAPGVLVTRQTLEAYGRTDVCFTRIGTDPLTDEALVDVDFAPPRAADAESETARLTPIAAEDIEGMHFEETAPDYEGEARAAFTNYYERQPHLRARAIAIHGTICKGCGFDFRALYGELGKDYIEVHHCKPVSTLGGATLVDPATDLTVLCSNCHRMVHRRRNSVLSIEELCDLMGGRSVVIVEPAE